MHPQHLRHRCYQQWWKLYLKDGIKDIFSHTFSLTALSKSWVNFKGRLNGAVAARFFWAKGSTMMKNRRLSLQRRKYFFFLRSSTSGYGRCCWTGASSRAARTSSPRPSREGESGTPSRGPGKFYFFLKIQPSFLINTICRVDRWNSPRGVI